jgi:hypothetical protein
MVYCAKGATAHLLLPQREPSWALNYSPLPQLPIGGSTPRASPKPYACFFEIPGCARPNKRLHGIGWLCCVVPRCGDSLGMACGFCFWLFRV